MSTMPAFKEEVKNLWNTQLPFVVYRLPGTSMLTCIVQDTDTLHYLTDWKTEGFIMAPFDKGKPVVQIRPDRNYNYKVNRAEEGRDDDENREFEKGLLSSEAKTYIEKVASAKNYIRSSDLQKIVLSRKLTIEQNSSNSVETFFSMEKLYPDAMVYFWSHPRIGTWLGATPETLLDYTPETIRTMALAGTQPKQSGTNETWGGKEREEQHLVTEAILEALQNLGIKTEYSGPVTSYAGNLAHLRTDILGRHSSIPIENVIKSLHPTPAICGWPTSKAFEYIKNTETYDREFYTGYLGYFRPEGQTQFFVNLRCMQWKESKAHIYVGGGITAQSDPESEWWETVRKSQTLLRAFRIS